MDYALIGVAIACGLFVLWGLVSHFRDGLQGRPRQPGLTWNRAENGRRRAEYDRQLAEWRAARGR